MNNEQYLELSGKIQGITDTLFALVAVLDQQELINARDFAADLSRMSVMRKLSPHLDSARYQLSFLADRIEEYNNYKAGLRNER